MSEIKYIKEIVRQNALNYGLVVLAGYMKDRYPQSTSSHLLLPILVNLEVGAGNVCLALDCLEQRARQLGVEKEASRELSKNIASCAFIGTSENSKPIILHNEKLYFNRHFHNEKSISDYMQKSALENIQISTADIENINCIFKTKELVDYQKVAAVVALKNKVSIISGGPGTGKTWAIGKILQLITQQNASIRIKLAAPTGKAASRLSSSIQLFFGNSSLACDGAILEKIPKEAVTLHKLLSINRSTHKPRYDIANKLGCDLLVLDEVSMIDQQMMAYVCRALPETSRLILLGDKDQLSSVEAGSVFADLCGGINQTEFYKLECNWFSENFSMHVTQHDKNSVMANNVVVLQKSYRFDEHSSIGNLARLVNQGNSHGVLQLLETAPETNDLRWIQVEENNITQELVIFADATYLIMMDQETIEAAFTHFNQYQILSAIWSGAGGVHDVNAVIEHYVKSMKEIPSDLEFYAGKPIMITQNNYQYDIYNGDTGIIWPNEEGQLMCYFEKGKGDYKSLSLSQLTHYISAYSITVHKSQGSEFEHVLMIFPFADTAVVTRELFYTGVTRASKVIEVWGNRKIIKNAVEKKTKRMSGLLENLQC